jgi:hypothetical protein
MLVRMYVHQWVRACSPLAPFAVVRRYVNGYARPIQLFLATTTACQPHCTALLQYNSCLVFAPYRLCFLVLLFLWFVFAPVFRRLFL